ncbi:hypothetical protein KKB99_06690, partial [bacterium]|nr:hypothetical protein [bacterium]MBU1025677.1 hypothetical protein [bacterium]
MRTTAKILLSLIIMLISVSCSKTDNPTTISPLDDQALLNELPLSEMGNPNTAYTPGIFGAWEVVLNLEDLTAEIIPARNAAAIGNIFDADLFQFLTVSPCSNCLMISGLRFDGNNKLNLDIWMKHPFADITKRPDLHGFDVRAIFIGTDMGFYYNNSISMMKPDGSQPLAELNPYFILNADGYTSHFDELVTDPRYFFHGEDVPGNLNPYLRFFESYSTGVFDFNAPTGYNVMPVGSADYLRTAVIGLNSLFGSPKFYIVADVAYGQSAVFATRSNPEYYLPSFNRTEPWRVEYWVENNNLSITNPNS